MRGTDENPISIHFSQAIQPTTIACNVRYPLVPLTSPFRTDDGPVDTVVSCCHLKPLFDHSLFVVLQFLGLKGPIVEGPKYL